MNNPGRRNRASDAIALGVGSEAIVGRFDMFKEFKEFAMRGNVLDMAVGIIIGAAFGKIVSSFVADIIMPPLGMALGHMDFSQLFIALNGQHYESLAAAKEAAAPTLNYGAFINTILDFLIVAFAIFLLIKAVNTAKRKKEVAPAEPTTKKCPRCLSEIPIAATRCAYCTSDV
jgi:large conductance mechanosensitive channel